MNGDTRVAYQGGGVWKHDNDQTSVVSPPEFHYRHGTLTLPVINVRGDDRTTGESEIIIRQSGETNRIYPNPNRTYEDEDTEYVNPINEGRIKVVIKSEYYLGWKDFFEDRTEGDVTIDPEAETVNVELITFGDQGETELVNGESISIRAANETDPMKDFSLTLAGEGSSDLKNLDWGLEIDGTRVIHLHAQGSGNVSVTINDVDSDEEWTVQDVYEVEEGDPATVEVDLMSNETASHSGNKDDKAIGEIINDLISNEGGEVDLTVEDSPGSQRVDHSQSSAHLDYESSGSLITYLHVTENDVEVEFN